MKSLKPALALAATLFAGTAQAQATNDCPSGQYYNDVCVGGPTTINVSPSATASSSASAASAAEANVGDVSGGSANVGNVSGGNVGNVSGNGGAGGNVGDINFTNTNRSRFNYGITPADLIGSIDGCTGQVGITGSAAWFFSLGFQTLKTDKVCDGSRSGDNFLNLGFQHNDEFMKAAGLQTKMQANEIVSEGMKETLEQAAKLESEGVEVTSYRQLLVIPAPK